MTTPDDESADELTRAYRSASDAQAGSPAASTRAAILAEARAATRKRTPAANDSRYVWRAAAGIAVLGVAVILWRQTDHRLAPDLAAAPENTVAARSPVEAPQPAADGARSDSAGAGTIAENRPATVRLAESTAKDEKKMSSKAATAREETSAELAASQVVASEVTASAAPPAQLARASADAAAPVPPPAAAQAAGAVRRQNSVDYQQLVQREFPDTWKGTEPPHIVWVVLDANGKVLRKGELSPGASVTADQPFESQRPWQMVKVVTASGSSLQLAVMSVN